MNLRIGIDIGSTTVKVVVLDEQNNLLFRSYERHFSKVREKTCEILERIAPRFSGVIRCGWSSPAPPVWAWPRPAASTSCRRCTPPPPP